MEAATQETARKVTKSGGIPDLRDITRHATSASAPAIIKALGKSQAKCFDLLDRLRAAQDPSTLQKASNPYIHPAHGNELGTPHT